MKFLVITVALILMTGGCSNAQEVPSDPQESERDERVISKHFESASSFTSLWEKANAYKDKGLYEQALKVWEEASKLADNRSFETIVFNNMAQIYEITEKYEFAANFYEAASKSTMNENRMHEFKKKAAELRQKAGLPTARRQNEN